MNRIEFSVEEYRPDWGRWRGVVPVIDGVSPIAWIHEYEAVNNWDQLGAWAFHVCRNPQLLDKEMEYLARPGSVRPNPGRDHALRGGL